MRSIQRHFLPDRFRPRMSHRQSRRGLAVPVVVGVAVLLALPLWTVTTVEVRGGETVPESVTASLEGLVGHMVPLLDLEWLHAVAGTWPAASEVRVNLDLPGTIVIEIFPESSRGSVAVGSGWHAVAADGRLVGAIDGPSTPVLVGFRRPSDRREAFSVARRLAEASGGEVIAVNLVTPVDYRVELDFETPGRTTTVHVTPEGTEAEKAWCELVNHENANIEWADLRWAHRLVLRGAA